MQTQIETIRMPSVNRRLKFLDLANNRIERMREQFRLIENLFKNPNAYEYTNEDIEKIQRLIEGAAYRLHLYRKEIGIQPMFERH